MVCAATASSGVGGLGQSDDAAGGFPLRIASAVSRHDAGKRLKQFTHERRKQSGCDNDLVGGLLQAVGNRLTGRDSLRLGHPRQLAGDTELQQPIVQPGQPRESVHVAHGGTMQRVGPNLRGESLEGVGLRERGRVHGDTAGLSRGPCHRSGGE